MNITKPILLILVLTFFLPIKGKTQTWNPDTDSHYNLVWEDNFTSLDSTYDATKWKTRSNYDHYGEPQVYLDRNVIVINGNLNIILEYETYRANSIYLDSNQCAHQLIYGTDYEYTSGWLESKANYSTNVNSYVEARIKAPYGKSYWPAFWLFSADGVSQGVDYNEIDIVEILGWLGKDTVTSNTHWDDNDNNPMITVDLNELGITNNYCDDYLTYGALWRTDSIIFFINHIRSAAVENIGQMNPEKLIFNFALRHDVTTGIVIHPEDSIRCPDTMFVDYVRVYEYNPDPTATTNKQKEPYLINPLNYSLYPGYSLGQMQLMWQLNQTTYNLSSGYCMVELGADSTDMDTVLNIPQISGDHLYKKMLLGNHGQKYYYRVTVMDLNNQPLSNQPFPNCGSFRFSPDPSSTSVKFYAYGDTQGGTLGTSPPNHDPVCSQILSEIAADPSSQTMLLHVGDWNERDYESGWNGEYFRSDNRNANKLRRKIALMGVKGNHDKYTYEEVTSNNDTIEHIMQGANLKKYFPFPYRSNKYTGNDFSYSFDYGPVHILALYVNYHNYNLSQIEQDWIDEDLSNTDKKWKVIMFHAPIKGMYDLIAGPTTVSFIKQKAKQYGVQLVLMGHQHTYAHWVDDGTHYLTVGVGGGYVHEVYDSIITSDNEIYAATVASFAKFDIKNDVMKVDIIQGKGGWGYNEGRRIEKFSIPISTQITNTVVLDNLIDYPIISDRINIMAGGELIVKSTMAMPKDAKIIVAPNGKLLIDDTASLITNYKRKDEWVLIDGSYNDKPYNEAEELWQGILVQGNIGLLQTPETNQGVLEIKNSGKIMNAKTAIMVADHFDDLGSIIQINLGGGIIKVDDAQFLNNQKDIVMKPYRKMVNNNMIAQKSYIKFSSFKNDANMLENVLTHDKKLGAIYLSGISNINIIGNKLENLDISLPTISQGVGINIINSSATITEGCNSNTTPCTDTIKNEFNNLYQGIRVINGLNANDLVKISNNEFTNTYRAIFLSGTNGSVVLENDIEAAKQAAVLSGKPDPGHPYGIYIDGGSGFRVEENKIERPSAYGTATFNGARGIIVENTGVENNEVYYNTSNNLFMSVQAQGFNSGKGTNAYKGLKFFCNTSQTERSSYDFYVFGHYYFDNWSLNRSGIATAQKQSIFNSTLNQYEKAPAGNVFSNSHLGITQALDFDNGMAQELTYTWGLISTATGRVEPLKFLHIQLDEMTGIYDACPSKISTGGNGNNPTDLYTKLNTAQIAYNSSKVLLDIWKDGGNANLDEEVKTIQPWDVYVEFNNLLSESPYLSEDVMIEVINNSAFTSLMVKLLMIANPHARENFAIMQALEERIPTMPQSYIDEIKSQPEVSSQLILLEGNVAVDYHLISNIGEDIKRIYRADNINSWAKDSLINFVSRQPDLYDKFELANIYLSYGDYENMQTVLDAMPEDYEMDDEMTTEYNEFSSILEISRIMQEEDLYENSLNETQKESLESILQSDRPIVSQIALSLLMRDNPNFDFVENVNDVEQNTARKSMPSTINVAKIENVEFKLYPNPSINYTMLQYNCKYINMSYTISDIQGRILVNNSLETFGEISTNEVLINLNKLSPGNYQIIIKTNERILWTEKLIITQ